MHSVCVCGQRCRANLGWHNALPSNAAHRLVTATSIALYIAANKLDWKEGPVQRVGIVWGVSELEQSDATGACTHSKRRLLVGLTF